jgi:hypothetical protein
MVSRRFGSLDEFFAVSRELSSSFEYTVSWIDCLAGGAALGRGWFMAGDPCAPGGAAALQGIAGLNFFLEPPVSLVNVLTLRAFNFLYYHRPVPETQVTTISRSSIRWTRCGTGTACTDPGGSTSSSAFSPRRQGNAGSGISSSRSPGAAKARSWPCSRSSATSSPGLLSFPRPGPTLALDFPNRGAKTVALLKHLEAMVMEAGGALYPAKDALMSPDTFRRSYPRWEGAGAPQGPGHGLGLLAAGD